MTTAAIYIRVSSPGQEQDGTSLDTQLARCRQHAAERGLTVDEAHVYREVHTGTELWERLKLSALREAIRRRDVSIVIAYAIDRLSRDPVHLGVVLSEAEHAGAAVQFVTEPLDDSPEGQLIRFVRGYAAKVEHEKIRERAIRGRRHRVELGKPLAGPRALYGYRWRDAAKSGLDVDPITAPIVRRLFADALAGTPLRSIMTALNEAGIPTPSGKRSQWGHTTVRHILTDERYTGDATALRWRTVKERGQKAVTTLRSSTDRVSLPVGTFPALIEADDFHAVAARLRQNQLSAIRRAKDPERYLLRSGFIHCALCGQAMTVYTRPTGEAYYRCVVGSRSRGACRVHTIATHRADAMAWDRVRAIFTTRGLIARELERLQGEDPAQVDIEAVDRAIAEVSKRQAGIARTAALVTDEDAAAPLAAALQELAERKRHLAAERSALLAQRNEWQVTRQQLAGLEVWCEAMAATLDELDYSERRQALHALGLDVRVAPGGVVDVLTAIKLPSVDTTTRTTGSRPATRRRWRRSAPRSPPATATAFPA